LRANCPDFITKDQWLPNSPDINQIDYHVWGAMLETYSKLETKPKTIAKLKEALLVNGYLGQPATGTNQLGCETETSESD